MLTLYISEALDVSKSRVFSVDNPVPIPAPEMVFGDGIPTELFLVDGAGDYSDLSGASGTSVKVGIGTLTDADPVWTNSNWTRITNGWSGVISPNTQAVQALFLGRNVFTAALRIKVIDNSGNEQTKGVWPFRLWNIGIAAGISASTGDETDRDGTFDIPNGADSVTVTGLGLTQVPRQVIPFVIKPAGGGNLFPTLIDGTITTDGFQVDLGGETDSADYKLGYLLKF